MNNNFTWRNNLPSVIRFMLLSAIFVAGFIFRYNNLEGLSFWADEFLHVNAAKSILQSGLPLLSSGFSYTRSLPYTYCVAASFYFLGISEHAARLPSVIFGVGVMLATYVLARKIANRGTAFLALAIIAFSPFMIAWSRDARMYMMFIFAFLFTTVLACTLLGNALGNKERLKLLLLFLLMFTLSLSLHQLTVFLVPVIIAGSAYVLLRNKSAISLNGSNIVKTRWHIIVLPIISVIIGAGFIFWSQIAQALGIIRTIGRTEPSLAESGIFYTISPSLNLELVKALLNQFPIIPSIILIVFGIGYLLRRGHPGVFLILALLVPLAIHSTIAGWEGRRYILYLMPFYAIVLSAGAYAIAEYAYHIFSRIKHRQHEIEHMRVALISLALLVFFRIASISTALAVPNTPHGNTYAEYHANYRLACKYISQRMKPGDIIISTLPSATNYYLGRTDYFLRSITYEKNAYIDKRGYIREQNEDTIVLRTLDELKAVVHTGSRGWIIGDERFDSPLVNADVREYIIKNMIDHSSRMDGTIAVFQWNNAES